MARTIVTPIQMRFSDLDPFHHVNNVAQQMYFDVGKSDYYERVAGEELLADRLRIVTVSTQTSYLGQVRSGDRLTVETACERIGTKSLTLFQRLMADIQAGKINCIVVKDLSRFGRNYVEAGNYLGGY